MLTLARKAELILLALTFIWGSTFVLVKIALGYSSPFLFLATRFFIATLVVRLIFADKYKVIPKETIRAGIILGIFLFFGFAFQTLGLRLTSASKSAFITSISFVLVTILA
ncbi:MAG TPA: EamA family transporter, partial [candidate division Zixibacteria bacterium]|nr:EamA family transporter [candidate division Zixibacteria bacterium]